MENYNWADYPVPETFMDGNSLAFICINKRVYETEGGGHHDELIDNIVETNNISKTNGENLKDALRLAHRGDFSLLPKDITSYFDGESDWWYNDWDDEQEEEEDPKTVAAINNWTIYGISLKEAASILVKNGNDKVLVENGPGYKRIAKRLLKKINIIS